MQLINTIKQKKSGNPAHDSGVAQSPSILKFSANSKMIFDFTLDQPFRDEWLEFWQSAKHSHAQQHYCHSEIESAKCRKPIFVAGIKNKKIVIAGIFSIKPLLANNKYSLEAVCLRGPVFDDINVFTEFLPRIIQQFRIMNVGNLRISPYWKYPEAAEVEEVLKNNGFIPYYPKEGSRSFTGYIDLSIPVEEMYKHLSKSAKESIKRMNALGIEFKDVTEFEDINGACKSFNSMRKRGGMSQMSEDEFRATFKWVCQKQEIGILTNAYKDGHFLGTLWSMRGPQVAHLMGYAIEHEITNKLVKRYTLGFMLWWRHCLWAKEKGASFYDVEGFREDALDTHPLKRIWDFKQKLGAKNVDILSEHILVLTRSTYLIYRAARFYKKGKRFMLSLPHQLHKRTCTNFSREGQNGQK